jgi:hypothetical protein
VVSYRVGRDEAGHRAARWWLSLGGWPPSGAPNFKKKEQGEC